MIGFNASGFLMGDLFDSSEIWMTLLPASDGVDGK